MHQSLRHYRESTTAGATLLDLMLAAYDGMAEDLRLSAEAAAKGEIAARCARSQHALVLLGHLESWLPTLEEAALEEQLKRFYAHVRAEILRLQGAPAREGFEEVALQVGKIRAAWQLRPARATVASEGQRLPAAEFAAGGEFGAGFEDAPRVSFSA